MLSIQPHFFSNSLRSKIKTENFLHILMTLNFHYRYSIKIFHTGRVKFMFIMELVYSEVKKLLHT
jgi:hypothetical protein